VENKYPVMTDERIAELQNFKTKDFSDCPAQTPEQLKEFKPKSPRISYRQRGTAEKREGYRGILSRNRGNSQKAFEKISVFCKNF
jgi:hypothetical protein